MCPAPSPLSLSTCPTADTRRAKALQQAARTTATTTAESAGSPGSSSSGSGSGSGSGPPATVVTEPPGVHAYARLGPTHDGQPPFCWHDFQSSKDKRGKQVRICTLP